MLLRFLIILFITTVFYGCKKNDEMLTNFQLLAGTTSEGKSWEVVAQSINGNSVNIANCAQDDTTTFFLSLEYLFSEGILKCDPDDPQNISGGWVFDESETHLLISTGSDIEEYEIISLTAEELTLKTNLLDLETIVTYGPL